MASKTATINGINMRWKEQGEGLPVVFIHGIPTSPALWRKVLPRVKKVRCLAFEMVGYGDSIPEGIGRDISVGRQADYLMDWLDHLGVEEAVFVGHDLGGGVAQIAAVRHPHRCRGLFFTNAICYDSWPIPSVKALRMTGPAVRLLPDRVVDKIILTLMLRGHQEIAAARKAAEVHWEPYHRHDGAKALIRQVKALDVRDTLEVAHALPTLNVPARCVWGAADQFQKIKYGERLASDLSAPLYRINSGKHFTPEDHPDIIAGEVNKLIEDVIKD